MKFTNVNHEMNPDILYYFFAAQRTDITLHELNMHSSICTCICYDYWTSPLFELKDYRWTLTMKSIALSASFGWIWNSGERYQFDMPPITPFWDSYTII